MTQSQIACIQEPMLLSEKQDVCKYSMSGLHFAAVDRLISRTNPLCHYNTRSRRVSYARGFGSSQSPAPPRTRVGWFYYTRRRIPGRLRSAARGKKRAKKAAAGEQFRRTRTRRGPDQGQSSYSRLKNRLQLLAIVRHDLASNHAHKSWFRGGRGETCWSCFRGKLSIGKDPRFSPLICIFVIKIEFEYK